MFLIGSEAAAEKKQGAKAKQEYLQYQNSSPSHSGQWAHKEKDPCLEDAVVLTITCNL